MLDSCGDGAPRLFAAVEKTVAAYTGGRHCGIIQAGKPIAASPNFFRSNMKKNAGKHTRVKLCVSVLVALVDMIGDAFLDTVLWRYDKEDGNFFYDYVALLGTMQPASHAVVLIFLMPC